ncbi:MAG: PKD domain-containing protein, partial [Pirellulales bacterium]
FSGYYISTTNQYQGVSFTGQGIWVAGEATVGGSAAGAGNLISGLLGTPLSLANAAGSVIQGNIIGLDATGTKVIGNYGDGIDVAESYVQLGDAVLIGGPLAGDRNIISGNSKGIDLSTDNNIVQGNYIGTDITGLEALPNGDDGVRDEGNNNLIGGPAPGDGNVISGNRDMGVRLDGITTGSLVQGNLIGVGADGITPLGNAADGVGTTSQYTFVASAPSGGLVGGLDPGDGNVIAYNRSGVDVYNGVQIAILSNSIFNNVGLGIDLGLDGPTPNDPGDADAGENSLQNYPVISGAVSDGTHTTVTGTFNSTASAYFTLQFFVNDTPDPSGYGEGLTLLGTRYLKTDANGNAAFTFTFSTGVVPSENIAATATDSQNDTSEFSTDYLLTSGVVAPNQPPVADPGGPYTINEGDSLMLDASHSSDPDGDPLSYTWDINGDGVFGDATTATPTLSWAELNALGIVNGPSSFTLALRVDDGQGHVVTSQSTLTVLNVAPTASAGDDQNVTEGESVTLTGVFTDPGTVDTHTFNWHVDDDNGQAIADGAGQDFSFVPDDAGTYTVTYTVTDSDGGLGSSVVHVYVADAPPVATILGAPAQGTVGVPINLSASVTDASPVNTAAGFQYFWQADNDDNDDDYFTSQDPDFSFTPTDPGTYEIYLYVSDKNGGLGYAQQSLVVVNNTGGGTTPSVTLGANSTINEGDTYTSSGSFVDPDPGDSWTATVNYGDGTGNQPLSLNADQTFDLSHVYTDNGNYPVTVSVTDSTDLTGMQSAQVTVNNVAPAVALAQPSPVTVDAVFNLTGSFTDPGDNTWTATVDYGDGSGDLPLTLAADKTFTLSHTYQGAGSFDAVVTVTDDDGGIGTASFTEAVSKLQTSLTAASASATYGGATTLSGTLVAAGNASSGKTLLFSLNGIPIGSAVTDTSGTATLPNVSIGFLHAGLATISVAFAEDALDLAANSTSTLSIAKASLTITADSKSKIYGSALP